jgi:hypothetical protein
VHIANKAIHGTTRDLRDISTNDAPVSGCVAGSAPTVSARRRALRQGARHRVAPVGGLDVTGKPADPRPDRQRLPTSTPYQLGIGNRRAARTSHADTDPTQTRSTAPVSSTAKLA